MLLAQLGKHKLRSELVLQAGNELFLFLESARFGAMMTLVRKIYDYTQ